MLWMQNPILLSQVGLDFLICQYAKPPYDSESIGFKMGKIVVLSKNYVEPSLKLSSEHIFRIVLFHTLHSKISLKFG